MKASTASIGYKTGSSAMFAQSSVRHLATHLDTESLPATTRTFKYQSGFNLRSELSFSDSRIQWGVMGLSFELNKHLPQTMTRG